LVQGTAEINMARYQVSSARLAVFVVSGLLLGMLCIDLRADQWFWGGSGGGGGGGKRGMEFAAQYYHHLDKTGSFVPQLTNVCLAIVGSAGILLILSHNKPESDTHTVGSSSMASDMFNILLFVIGAPYFVLHVQPALARIVASVGETGSQNVKLDDQMKHDLEVVAQGHLVLILIVGLVLLTSATFMKRLDGAAVARRKTE
jgi:hypothetical protein